LFKLEYSPHLFVVSVQILYRPVISFLAYFGKEASGHLFASAVIRNAFTAFAVTGTWSICTGAGDSIITSHFKPSYEFYIS